MFGQILTMYSFTDRLKPYYDGTSSPEQGLLTAILELGAWIGVLINGWLADAVGRRQSVVIGCVVFCAGVIVQACTPDQGKDYILAGRFVTGLGVGAYSMLVPLYVGASHSFLGAPSDRFTGTTLSWHPQRPVARWSPCNSLPSPLAS